MARRRRKKRKNRGSGREELPTLEVSPHVKRGIGSVIFLVLAVITMLAFFGGAGSLGDVLTRVFRLLFGWVFIILPLLFLLVALALFLARHQPEEEVAATARRIYWGTVLFLVGVTGGLHVLAMRDERAAAVELVKAGTGGGYFGLLTAFPLFSLVDFWASLVVLLGLTAVAVILVWGASFRVWLKGLRERRAAAGAGVSQPVKINKMASAGFSSSAVSQEEAKEEAEAAVSVPVRSFDSEAKETISYGVTKEQFRKGNWQLPPLDFLEDAHDTVDSGNIEANVKIIEKTLADFGIPVEMGEVNVGPTVTQYTLRPAQGIKLSQIVTLQNDLALALAASSIRIEAPIPGRSLVGIEVPNKATAIVRLKDILQTEQFLKHKSNLAFTLGRDVAGHAMVADLARMPHLLIAGATGTGKSIAINSLILSLLYRNSPEELRLIVIDPKRVELTLYNGIPQLLTEVVIDHQQAINAFKWAVAEMDRRYHLLASANRRNIIEYNAGGREQLPYIVVVVDELADLMATSQADVEAAVVRLAQMARAVGIHLVLATQRPSVDIITGLIKANITARMAFAVASQVDSRTILDIAGAEKLLGAGDMLYITAELGKPKRIQGTYVSEREAQAVVEFLKNQAGEVVYQEEILVSQPGSPVLTEASWGEEDELLPEAVEAVRRAGKASASLLQRRLRIGYARAARLLDLMEERGIIGPADGAKPRDVYLTDDRDEAGDY